jgi:ABC-type transporter Mla MlaB component
LRLPPQVDAAAVAALYRDAAARIATLTVIDFSAVKQIDSAGVALVLALRALRRSAIELRAVPERFTTLCLAHRVALAGD